MNRFWQYTTLNCGSMALFKALLYASGNIFPALLGLRCFIMDCNLVSTWLKRISYWYPHIQDYLKPWRYLVELLIFPTMCQSPEDFLRSICKHRQCFYWERCTLLQEYGSSMVCHDSLAHCDFGWNPVSEYPTGLWDFPMFGWGWFSNLPLVRIGCHLECSSHCRSNPCFCLQYCIYGGWLG